MNKLNKLVTEIIAELLKEEPELLVKRKLSYNEPSIGRPEDHFNELDDKEIEIEESSTTAGVDGFMTPNAFSAPGQDPKKKKAVKAMDWPVVEGFNKGDIVRFTKEANPNLVGHKAKIIQYKGNGIYRVGILDKNVKTLSNNGEQGAKVFDVYQTLIVKENINESQQSPWEKFLLTIEATAEGNIKEFLFDPLKEPYIDTPGDFHMQGRGSGRGSITSYMKRNMGSSKYQDLYNFYRKYKTRCDAFVKKFGHVIDIYESVDFKDPEMSPRKKIACAVKGMREQLMEIENILDKSVNFKEESGLKTSDFYKRTHNHLKKIGEQVTRIMNKIQTIK